MPATALSVPPVQVVLAAGVAAKMTPDGRLLDKLRPVASISALALEIEYVTTDVAPSTIDVGAKAIPIVGTGAAVTVSDPDTAGLVPTAVVKMLEVFAAAPIVTDVTGTVIVQVAPAPTIAPLREIPEPPAAAPNVPPHEFVAAGVAAIAADVGTLSVNEIADTPAPPAVLLMV